jgi:hypothetical protein
MREDGEGCDVIYGPLLASLPTSGTTGWTSP